MTKSHSVAHNRFIAELQKIAFDGSNAHFSYDNLYKIASDIRLQYDRFEDLIERLNSQGYLLKRGNKMYKLATI